MSMDDDDDDYDYLILKGLMAFHCTTHFLLIKEEDANTKVNLFCNILNCISGRSHKN
jgi:hypothetical protein